MIQIDQNICTGCGLCFKDCPLSAIRLEGGKAAPIQECIMCGHCAAICPESAVELPGYDMSDVEEYREECFSIESDKFLRAVKFRRSIRQYREKPVERGKLERILQAGRYTATARNMQDCRFILVQEGLEEFKKMMWQEMPKIVEGLRAEKPAYAKAFDRFYGMWEKDGTDMFFFDCPVFLTIASDNPLDGGLAAANIENMAVAEKLGVLYNGYLMGVLNASGRLRDWLEIGGKQVACCMLLGYPKVAYRRTAPRKKGDIVWK